MSDSLNQSVYKCDSSLSDAQVFDLFCSVGGLTYGLKRAGIAVKGRGDQTLGKGRPVMVRKGIGKLSVLSIALINKRKWKLQHE